MTGSPTRILIVDDSALYRQSIRNVLRGTDCAEVVGSAKDGRDALAKIVELDPDLLTLDVQMPDMDGIAVLREIKSRRLRAKAVMVSSLTSAGAQVTTDALLYGAFDFILKPSSGDPAKNRQELQDALNEKIAAFRLARADRPEPAEREPSETEAEARLMPRGDLRAKAKGACRAVLFGASTGGPAAFKLVLPRLPADLSAPILLVQHMPPQYTSSLARRLDELCEVEVREAASGDELRPGVVLVAPGGRQMGLARDAGRVTVQITDDPPEHGCRPAVDYLFRSAAQVFDGQVLGVVMTGMGRDGSAGAAAIREGGGSVFAQDQDGCTVFGMPKAVIQAGVADRVLPLGRLAAAITRHVKRSRRV